MIERLKITVLTDNTAGGMGLLAEHGLAFWIEADDHRILFDTGQGNVLRHNAELLEIDLSTAESVVLSHGHYDHTGGLSGGQDWMRHATLYAHPGIFQRRYSRRPDGSVGDVGAGIGGPGELRARFANVVETPTPTRIVEGIDVTGEVPRRTDYEDSGGAFYLDEGCARPDVILDDQSMYVETPSGIVVVLGCTHAGLVNTLDYIAELTGRRTVYAVLGGMHLLRASQERLRHSLDALDRYDVQVLAPCHCTGLRAMAAIMQQWPDRFQQVRTGWELTISS